MAGKADFTPDEWKLLLKSPMLAALVVVAASPSGPFGVIKEMMALGKLVAETKAKGGDALVNAVVNELTTREGMEQAKPTEIQGMSPDQARAHALDQLKQTSALVRRRRRATRPDSRAGCRRWQSGWRTPRRRAASSASAARW